LTSKANRLVPTVKCCLTFVRTLDEDMNFLLKCVRTAPKLWKLLTRT
jgi:hypothetical protein